MRGRGGAVKPVNITVHIPSKSDKIPSRCSLTEIPDILSECRSSERARKETAPQMKLQQGKKTNKQKTTTSAGLRCWTGESRWSERRASPGWEKAFVLARPPPLPCNPDPWGTSGGTDDGRGHETPGKGPPVTFLLSSLFFIRPPSTSFSPTVTRMLFCGVFVSSRNIGAAAWEKSVIAS